MGAPARAFGADLAGAERDGPAAHAVPVTASTLPGGVDGHDLPVLSCMPNFLFTNWSV